MDEPDASVPWTGVVEPDGLVASEDCQHQPSSDDPTWTFAREGDELMLARPKHSHGLLLVVTMNKSSRTFTFPSDAAAERFKSDMESLLLHTGWSFVGFTPDRRGRRDRRTFPRPIERRRWWTDGWLFFS
jgi:hypothetical protein